MPLPSPRRPHAAALTLLLTLGACGEAPEPTGLALEVTAPLTARSGGKPGPTAPRYQLRFVVTDPVAEGEIVSEPFPEGGVTLDLRDPFKRLDVWGARWDFVNYTHGVRGQGTCGPSNPAVIDWDIAGTEPVRSFAGSWEGSLSLWKTRGTANLALSGVRVGGPGAITPNAVTNENLVVESRAADDSWFEIRFAHARLAFGGDASPDGLGDLHALPGYEDACVNLTLRAERMP